VILTEHPVSNLVMFNLELPESGIPTQVGSPNTGGGLLVSAVLQLLLQLLLHRRNQEILSQGGVARAC
jgi:hypothetical protein